MINKFLVSLSFFLLGLVATQVSSTSHAQNTQTPANNAQAPADTGPGGSAEFDLNLAGIKQSELQKFADEWVAARVKEGLTYATAVQTAQIKAKVGSNDYGDAFLIAVDDAMLSAHSQRASELVRNNIRSTLSSVALDRKGFEAKAKEEECQERNLAKFDAKAKVLANLLAAKAIESLGGTNDKSTDMSAGVKCLYTNLASEFTRSISIESPNVFLAGSRTLKLVVDGSTVSIAMAYGPAGIELANMIRANKPADKPNQNVRAEIQNWVENNMLATSEVLLSAGTRSFKLSNGEWVVVSLSVAGLPSQGNMSTSALAHRNKIAVDRAQAQALDGLARFAGITVNTVINLKDVAKFAEMFEVEIKDGVSSAVFDVNTFQGEYKKTISGNSKVDLKSPMVVKSGARKSEISQGNVAYAVVAWAPSLVSEAGAFESIMKKGSSSSDTPQGNNKSPVGQSKNMKEDW
jgi:hypothetical protein